MSVFSFQKHFRQISKQKIALLFEKANQFYESPFVVRYFTEPAANGVYKILISISRKKIPHAVSRNLIKRRAREAWRKNASSLQKFMEQKKVVLYINLHYGITQVADYQLIEEAIMKVIERLIKVYEKVA